MEVYDNSLVVTALHQLNASITEYHRRILPKFQ